MDGSTLGQLLISVQGPITVIYLLGQHTREASLIGDQRLYFICSMQSDKFTQTTPARRIMATRICDKVCQ